MLTPGALKSTYGTGCFVIINTGDTAILSTSKLLTTIGYRLKGQTSFALEGSIFVSGAVVQWLRDGLKIIDSAPETEEMASGMSSNNGVYMVLALTARVHRIGVPHARRDLWHYATLHWLIFSRRAGIRCLSDDDLFTAAGNGISVSGAR